MLHGIIVWRMVLSRVGVRFMSKLSDWWCCRQSAVTQSLCLNYKTGNVRVTITSPGQVFLTWQYVGVKVWTPPFWYSSVTCVITHLSQLFSSLNDLQIFARHEFASALETCHFLSNDYYYIFTMYVLCFQNYASCKLIFWWRSYVVR